MKSYDLIIIGGGPGGYVAALYASRHKKRVCVIEKASLGGVCLNKGCIPTKAMLYSASILSKIKKSKEYGIDILGYTVNFPAICARKDMVVTRMRAGIETLFKASKIDLIKGDAKLGGPDTVIVNGENYSAGSIIIAVGSRPMSLPGLDFDETNIYSSDGILELKDLPESLTIAGGGVIGCEFASLFNALGTKVKVVELMDRILPLQSKEISRKMETIFRKKGIEVNTSANFELGDKSRKVLIAVGRKPNTEDIGLEALGIETEKGLIKVDEHLRTRVKSIYAIGDCIAGPQLAHKASYDGITACDNILGNARIADYSNVPNCVWTDPEVASIGLNEEEARSKYPDAKIAKFPYLASGKAYIMGGHEGYVKLIGDSKGQILGVEILGEGACDLLGEAALAKSMAVNIKDWAGVTHGHPTLSEMFQEAAHIFTGTAIHGV